MTLINPNNGKPLKHYAQNEASKDRYIVISLQNEDDPNKCSVIKYDSLDSNLRAELIAAVNSDEFQSVPEIWKLLDKKYFYDYSNKTMLQVLKAMNQIKSVDQNLVKVDLPGDITMTPKEILNSIKEYEARKNNSKFNEKNIDAKDSKISEMEQRITNMENNISSLNNSIADLINAIKQQASVSNKE